MTTEDLEYVGFWPRVGAQIIDSIIVALVTAPLLAWIYRSQSNIDLNQLLTAGPDDLYDLLGKLVLPAGPAEVLINWVLPAVAVVLFWLLKEATPGKMLIRARVVDAVTGHAISTRQGIVRYLGYFVSIIPMFLGLIWVGIDRRKQGWHDKLAGTVVVRAKQRGPQAVRFDRH